jgi:hypothetical protein
VLGTRSWELGARSWASPHYFGAGALGPATHA